MGLVGSEMCIRDRVSGGAARFSNGVDGFGPLEAVPGLGGTVRRIEDANFAVSAGGIGLGLSLIHI